MIIPKALRTAIKNHLRTDTRPMSSSDICTNVNPTVKKAHQRTVRELAFVLKQMAREGDLLIASETKNGLTPSGNERSRVEYVLDFKSVDPDIVEES